MRKLFFAVLLIASSFAGGVVVNGPGLQWAQAMIMSRASGDESESGDEDSSSTKPKPAAPAEPFPAAPIPPLIASAEISSTPQPKPQSPKPADPAPTPATTPSPAPMPTPSGADLEAKAPEPSAPPAHELKAPEPLDPKALDLADSTPPKSAKDTPILLAKGPEPSEPGRPAGEAAKGAWAGASDSGAPAKLSPPSGGGANAEPPEASPPTGAPSSSNWTELRRRLAELGVSRYGFEGEPTGRVRFHCLIPLAGRRAVAQQFEAEGDDEFQAAEIAIRRVTLWRTAESPAP